MLINLFPQRPDHPLADAKELKRILAELHVEKAAHAVDELASWFESLKHARNFRLDHYFDVLRQLDDAGQPHLRRLARDYLYSPFLSRLELQRLWERNYGYWTAVAALYALCTTRARLEPKERGADAFKVSLPLADARNFLGRFLFSGDDVFKPISVLSGGQRSRVALARLTLQGANFLLLDEPTNHLDVASQEILQDVLDRFPGTVLLVSHDRYLVDALADEVWALRAGQLFIYKGGYQGYLRQREIEKVEAAGQRREETPADSGQERERMKEERRQRKAVAARAAQATDLETQIHAREAALAEVEQRLAAASHAADVERITALAAEHQAVQAEIETLMAAWAELV